MSPITSAKPLALKIDPALSPKSMQSAFKRLGRLHIPGILAERSAHDLYRVLAAETHWVCATTVKGTNVDIPIDMFEALSDQQKRDFMNEAYAEACVTLLRGDNLHYMFDTLRIDTPLIKGEAVAPAYVSVHEFLNSASFLNFIRDLTGDDRATFVDSRATRFRKGHYLTAHDDLEPGKSRLYAYVLNLTPDWRPDWGGMLQFIDADGHLAEAYAPRMNALNIFAVPQNHSVGMVTPMAGADRYSITGWIRSEKPH